MFRELGGCPGALPWGWDSGWDLPLQLVLGAPTGLHQGSQGLVPGRFKVGSEEWQGAASGGKEPVWPGVGRLPLDHCSLPAAELSVAFSGPQIFHL